MHLASLSSPFFCPTDRVRCITNAPPRSLPFAPLHHSTAAHRSPARHRETLKPLDANRATSHARTHVRTHSAPRLEPQHTHRGENTARISGRGKEVASSRTKQHRHSSSKQQPGKLYEGVPAPPPPPRPSLSLSHPPTPSSVILPSSPEAFSRSSLPDSSPSPAPSPSPPPPPPTTLPLLRSSIPTPAKISHNQPTSTAGRCSAPAALSDGYSHSPLSSNYCKALRVREPLEQQHEHHNRRRSCPQFDTAP
ncbi:hypothetical protein DFH27DRAFT_62352 [Peziza echinospora]|nr:hypothetical protein DFH27DRAFT_62352 [Peziza echinospora]